MTIEKIKEILTGTFTSVEDRKYWEERLRIEGQKEKTGKQNEEYFRKMSVYNR
jgi:hypothetical protein